jgi:adenosylcobinamide-GDP ribazoletransferase
VNERVRQFAAAAGLLTRLPIWRLVPQAPVSFAASVWAYPLVGGLLGALGGLIYALCWHLGLAPSMAGIWTIAALLLATGALHEDGLADTADGLGGGSTPERKLAIMRDSRIGSYGALALILALSTREAAVTLIATPFQVAMAFVVANAASRATIIVVLLAASPARNDGMASGLAKLPRVEACAGLAIALLLVVLTLPLGLSLAVVVLAVATGLGAAGFARAQIGGHTGDILGASAVFAECAVLALLAR